MEIDKQIYKNILKILLRDFSINHTITSLASELNVSRVGIWKVLKKLEEIKYIILKPVGKKKTSIYTIHLNWENILVEKALSLYLTEEALDHRRWRTNFADIEKKVDFLILFGSILFSQHEANDIDLIGVTSRKNIFVSIQQSIDKIQKTFYKKIHMINFTEMEFTEELLKPNKAYIEAIRKGVILFGQEKFVQLMKKVHL